MTNGEAARLSRARRARAAAALEAEDPAAALPLLEAAREEVRAKAAGLLGCTPNELAKF